MTKKERIEDMGRIREMLATLIDDLEDKYGKYLGSISGYSGFCMELLNSLPTPYQCDSLKDLHMFLSLHKEKLEDIYCVACGEEE